MRRTRSVLSGGRSKVALAVVCALSGLALAAESVRISDPQLRKSWEEGLTALSVGRFDEAVRLIHDVAIAEDDPQVRHINQWVREFKNLQEERARRIRADYDKYVSWVKEEAAREEWRSAMLHAAQAFNNAEDQEAFRREPWLLRTVEGAKKAALDFEAKSEWVKAATIWVRLTEIFPHDKEYREALDRCQAHIRLEYTYTPESDWRTTVSDITPDMARDAFRKIDSEYLTEPVFKDAVIAGLKQIIRLAQEPKLRKEFAELNDDNLREEFVTRVRARLLQAQDSDRLRVRDLIAYFDKVLDINRELKLFPQTVLIYEFVQGALQPLDRFSDMIWPADLAEFNKHTQGRFSGVGIQIRKDPGEPIKVVSPLEDTPAYRAGIQPGDMITKINGKSSLKTTITEAVRLITGPPGTEVTLTFKRPGQEEEFDVKLERQEITIFTIKGYQRDENGEWDYMIDPQQKIAYVRMTNFTEGTIHELKDVLSRLQRQGMRGLIFDLRGNPGGPLKAAVDVAELFLPPDKQIVSTKDRHGKDWATSSSSGEEHYNDFPLILLTNRTSASASEIVAGALQVHRRALIVGERTFGKGSVQQVLRLNNNNAAFLKLTTAHYYLPDGRCLHRDEDSVTWGVDPDVEIKLVPKEIIKANLLRLKTDILKGVNQKELSEKELEALTQIRSTTRPAAGDSSETQPSDAEDEESAEDVERVRDDPNDFPEVDAQLEGALMLMRVRLESNQAWPLRPARMAANAAAGASR